MWKLFIDDVRFPRTHDWVIARNSAAAIKQVQARGMPIEIAFDHDLGGDDTVFRFLNWLTEEMIDKRLQFPKGFEYSIHSQNPVGAQAIANRMLILEEHFTEHDTE